MGYAAFRELYRCRAQFRLVLLNRGSEKNRKLFAPYQNDPDVKLLWGDLNRYEDVLAGVSGADYVLHIGGMVSPQSDYYPKLTMKTNVGAARHIVDAVKAQPDPNAVKVAYIGTVAQTGDRNPPIHWGRCGDPIKISVWDHYAISKTIAERIFAESGLRYWVSLRQSGILYPDILKQYDPIMYHVPLNGVLEWATIEDSATLMRRVCEPDVPDSFWRKFYNIGSGKEFRVTNAEFEATILRQLGFRDMKRVLDCRWFALGNFHGQWFADSDNLEEILHFREPITREAYFKRMRKTMPLYLKLSGLAPRWVTRKFVMGRLTQTPVFGTMRWFAENQEERIRAYFGSRERWEAIRGWDDFELIHPVDTPQLLSHGYDESKPEASLGLADMQQAAAFRGGTCLSAAMRPGDLYTPLEWESAQGRRFTMTPNLVLRGGHWCPEELPLPWDYGREAERNPFFAQVWNPLYPKEERYFYGEEIYRDFPPE